MRARETANLLGEALGIGMKEVSDLRERNNYGILTGLTKAEAKLKFPSEVAELEKGIWHKVKKSEGYESFRERVIAANEKYATVAIVTHGGPIACLAREVLKIGEFERLGDCAFLEVESNANGLRILGMENASLAR